MESTQRRGTFFHLHAIPTRLRPEFREKKSLNLFFSFAILSVRLSLYAYASIYGDSFYFCVTLRRVLCVIYEERFPYKLSGYFCHYLLRLLRDFSQKIWANKFPLSLIWMHSVFFSCMDDYIYLIFIFLTFISQSHTIAHNSFWLNKISSAKFLEIENVKT